MESMFKQAAAQQNQPTQDAPQPQAPASPIEVKPNALGIQTQAPAPAPTPANGMEGMFQQAAETQRAQDEQEEKLHSVKMAPYVGPKSLKEEAKDVVTTILHGIGAPGTMEEVHAANAMLPGQLAHPGETAKRMGSDTLDALKGFLQPNDVQSYEKSKAAWAAGNKVESARHFIDYLIPYIGASADQAGDAVDTGEWGKAIGHTINAVLPFLFEKVAGGEKPVMSEAEAAKIASKQFRPAPPEGTEVGKKTTIRPTTQTTAGVEAPISALQQEEPSIIAQGAAKLTSPGAAAEFQKTQTAPAATRQLISTVGQVAEDKVAAHNALVNGEPRPESIAGTQTPSKLRTLDEAAQASKDSASQTYKKADAASNADVAKWQTTVKQALDEHKALIDRHNANIDAYNANLPEGAEPMPHAEFDANTVSIPEKPRSYSELKADLDQAHANGLSHDAAIREDAYKTGIPKAEKAVDTWFKQHSDVIDPTEYTSAKKLYADSERFQEVANGLRAAQNKGTISGNTMRGIEASMDNKMIRRGQAPGSFQRLLGPDGYENWQTVAKLFDPVKGSRVSWGGYAAEYLAAHFLGPMGLAGKVGSEWLLNRVMFSPEWGQWFSNAANYLKMGVKDFPDAVKSKFADLWKSEKGEAGAPGTVALGPEEEQATAHGENGGSTFTSEGKNLAGENRYSVGSYPDRTRQIPTALDASDIESFKKGNADLLGQPDHAVGTWEDPETGNSVLDVVKHYGDRDDAIAAGKAANQKAIYHLGGEGEIPTGGTGEALERQRVIPNGGDPARMDAIREAEANRQRTRRDIPTIHNVDPAKIWVDAEGQSWFRSGRTDAEMEKVHPSKQEVLPPSKEMPSIEAMKKKYGTTDDVHKAGFILPEGDMIPLVGEHDHMLGGSTLENTRESFVKDSGAIRTRYRMSRAGEEQVFSLPNEITPEQARQIRYAAANLKNGRIVLETVEGEAHESIDFPTAAKAQTALDKLVTTKEAPAETAPAFNLVSSSDGSSHTLEIQKDGNTIGHLNIEQGTPDSWTIKDAVVQRGETGKGYGKAAYNQAFKEARDAGMKTVESDISMTSKAKSVWQKLMAENPEAITEENGQFTADLDKLGPKPPVSGGEASEITTRRPKSVTGDRANNPGQMANMDAVNEAGKNSPSRSTAAGKPVMGYKEKLARTVADYTGVRYTPEELAQPDKIIGKFVNHVADNLTWLYDQVPEEIRAKTRQWYDSANEMTKGFAKDYGVTHEQAAGVTAALSPQNPWDNNVALAKRVMDTYKNRQNFDFTPQMERKIADLKAVPTQSKAFKGLMKDIAGKRLSEVTNPDPDVQAVQRALWIRLYDEAHNSPVNDAYSPTGEVTGHSPDARSWIGLDHMGKAVKILDNGSVDNINAVMGQGHKIRNFYNNIINPNSKNGHITIDTHAVSAAHLSPFGPKDTEAAHNFGGTTPGIPGAPKDAASGLQGTYPLYAEAYQRVAKKLGILPRELQSVTWEAIKALMGDEKKTPELKARVKEIWTQVQDGELTPAAARDMIKDEAQGFSKPAWMSDAEWEKHGPGGDASFNPGEIEGSK